MIARVGHDWRTKPPPSLKYNFVFLYHCFCVLFGILCFICFIFISYGIRWLLRLVYIFSPCILLDFLGVISFTGVCPNSAWLSCIFELFLLPASCFLPQGLSDTAAWHGLFIHGQTRVVTWQLMGTTLFFQSLGRQTIARNIFHSILKCPMKTTLCPQLHNAFWLFLPSFYFPPPVPHTYSLQSLSQINYLHVSPCVRFCFLGDT